MIDSDDNTSETKANTVERTVNRYEVYGNGEGVDLVNLPVFSRNVLGWQNLQQTPESKVTLHVKEGE